MSGLQLRGRSVRKCSWLMVKRLRLDISFAFGWLKASPGLRAVTLELRESDQVALAQRSAHFTVHAVFREVFGVDGGGRGGGVVVEVKRLRGAAR